MSYCTPELGWIKYLLSIFYVMPTTINVCDRNIFMHPNIFGRVWPSCVYLQSVDMYGCSTSPIHCVVSFIWSHLSFFLLQSFLLRGHFGFLLLNQFGTVQRHLQRKRGKPTEREVERKREKKRERVRNTGLAYRETDNSRKFRTLDVQKLFLKFKTSLHYSRPNAHLWFV